MPTTIQAIVCAVDFSPFSPLVVGFGKALARRAGVRLYLFHAVHNPQDGVHATAIFERGGDLAHLTDDAMRRMSELMNPSTLDWQAEVRFGDPVEQTAAFVSGLPPSLVVTASHGVSGFRRLFIGTVVERLTRILDRPMLVVKPEERDAPDLHTGFPCAVVSCDGNGHWQRLAPLLPLLQPDAASRIHLVHTLEGPIDRVTIDANAASYGQVQQAFQEHLNRGLQEQARLHFPRTGHISVSVSPGVPEETVLRIAREQASDLIVVGVRRSGKVGRWISGSTTEALLRRSPCCVLTIPEPKERKNSIGLHP